MSKINTPMRLCIAFTGLVLVSVIWMLGCASDGTGSDMGDQFGNGLSKLGHATTQVVVGAGHGLANAGSRGFNGTSNFVNGNNNYGNNNKLGELITLGSKLSDLLDMDNLQRQDQLGQAMAVAIMNRYPPSSDAQLNDYVNLVGMTMAAVSPHPELNYTFTVLDSDEVGALFHAWRICLYHARRDQDGLR